MVFALLLHSLLMLNICFTVSSEEMVIGSLASLAAQYSGSESEGETPPPATNPVKGEIVRQKCTVMLERTSCSSPTESFNIPDSILGIVCTLSYCWGVKVAPLSGRGQRYLMLCPHPILRGKGLVTIERFCGCAILRNYPELPCPTLPLLTYLLATCKMCFLTYLFMKCVYVMEFHMVFDICGVASFSRRNVYTSEDDKESAEERVNSHCATYLGFFEPVAVDKEEVKDISSKVLWSHSLVLMVTQVLVRVA